MLHMNSNYGSSRLSKKEIAAIRKAQAEAKARIDALEAKRNAAK